MPFSRNIPYHVAVRLTAWYWVPVFCHLILFTHPTPPPPHTHTHIFHFWHYSRPFATIRDYSPLFAIVHHYSRPFATIRDYPLFVIHVFQLPRCILESVKILFVLLQFYHITAELRSLRGGTRWTVRPQCILAYSFRKLTSALVCTIIRYSVATSCIT